MLYKDKIRGYKMNQSTLSIICLVFAALAVLKYWRKTTNIASIPTRVRVGLSFCGLFISLGRTMQKSNLLGVVGNYYFVGGIIIFIYYLATINKKFDDEKEYVQRINDTIFYLTLAVLTASLY